MARQPKDAVAVPEFDVANLPATFDAALEALREAGIEPQLISEFGDGFVLLKDKSALVGVDLMIITARVIESNKYSTADGPSSFSAFHIMTANNDKFVVVDGSSGLHRQHLDLLNRRGSMGGLVVKGGLVQSDYDYTDDKGVTAEATTFYFAGI